MKKVFYLFFTLVFIGCSKDDNNNDNNGCPINFECSTATANDFLSLEMVGEDYQSNVDAYGEPISEGLRQDVDGNYEYFWCWSDSTGNKFGFVVSCSNCSYGIINADCD